ncbi:MAG TPA: YceI family protein [Edaphocola sp.]|nr:YceI family protein [Edaphocola sp.]
MKKILYVVMAGAVMLASCGGAEGDKAEVKDQQEVATQSGETYTIDQNETSLKWKAYHKGGFAPRFGTINAQGTVSVENGAVVAGSVSIDMNSLVVDPTSIGEDEAKEGKKASGLEADLKSDNFFSVANHPTATFEITSVGALDNNASTVVEGATNTVSGNLTIKGKTVNVTFPAKIEVADEAVTVYSKFSINRDDWGLTYGTDGDPKDWGIAREVDIELNVKAKK